MENTSEVATLGLVFPSSYAIILQ